MPLLSNIPWRLPALRPQVWGLGALAAGLLYAAASVHLDERIFYAVQSAWHADSRQARSLWLPEYRVRVDARPVASISDNLSGLTFDERRNHL